MYSCPECSKKFASLEGVAMHYVNMEDGDHEKFDTKFDVKMAVDSVGEAGDGGGETVSETVSTDSLTVSDGGSQTAPESETQTDEYSLPEFEVVDRSDMGVPTDGSNEQCCGQPALTGSAGDVFRLESGEVIRLDENEQICMNCDTVSEVDK